MVEETFKPNLTIANRNVSLTLLRRGPKPDEWTVKQSIKSLGPWRQKAPDKEIVISEHRMLEMIADGAVRNMTRNRDDAIVSFKPIAKKKRMNPIFLAQLKRANHLAKLMPKMPVS